MCMGKGGVGKTTVAAAIAVALAQRGHSVHLTTTDPAGHLTDTLHGTLEQPERVEHRPRRGHPRLPRACTGHQGRRTSTSRAG